MNPKLEYLHSVVITEVITIEDWNFSLLFFYTYIDEHPKDWN